MDKMQRGREHGTSQAAGDVVLALDDDVVARPGMVTAHAREHAADDGRLVVLGYMPVVTPPRWPRSYAPTRFYAESYEEHADEYERNADYILRHLWGGNLSLRRSHWLEATRAGRVPNYHEDKEFGLLLQREGFRAKFDRQARGDHWYQRDLRGFVQRAEKTVPAQAQLRDAYEDVIDDAAWEDLPQRRSLQGLLRISRHRAGWFAVRWALIALTSIGAALRLRPLEDRAAEALWRVASERAEVERSLR
jgi:hypothetical protein